MFVGQCFPRTRRPSTKVGEEYSKVWEIYAKLWREVGATRSLAGTKKLDADAVFATVTSRARAFREALIII